MLIRDVRAEGHREREALRAELTGQINETRTELTGKIDDVRTELHQTRNELNGRIDRLSDKIDGLYKWIISILIAVGMSVIASLLKGVF